MPPFNEFRSWLHGAPGAERATTGALAIVVLGLLAWLLVPAGDAAPGEQFATTATTTLASPNVAPTTVQPPSGDAVSGNTQASVGLPSGGSATPQTASGGTQGCASPPGSAKGIAANEVRIAIALTEIVGPAANQVFNVASPEEQRANFEAIIAGINREGGAACRKLVAEYVTANPADESQMMSVCRDVADLDVFAIVDTGAMASRTAVLACLGQGKIPFFGTLFVPETLRRRFYPYVFSFYTKELLYRTSAFALRELGFFDTAKGFRKLGFIYKECSPESIQAFRGWIREAGVRDSQVVPYSVGCPSGFASPADLQQAVLTFQREGVTHVTAAEFQGDLPRFTSIAQQQGFRPRYGFPDENIISLSSGTLAPDPNNITDALAITFGRDAENRTPGMAPTAGTQRCDGYLRAAGRSTTWQQDETAGNSCAQLWMLQGALSHAPELSAAALAAGLQRTKSIDFSYPQGLNDFSGNGVTTGGQFWRVAQFMSSCECWQVVQRDFRRGY